MAGFESQRETARRHTPAGGELSPAEFAAMFEQSFRVLWYIALGFIHDRSLAEDVVQEAAIIALGKLDQFQRGTNFVAWMGQTVRYTALNLARRHRRHLDAVTDPTLLEADAARSPRANAPAPPPVRLTAQVGMPGDQPAFDDRIVRALDSINETARACLLLRTIEGMDYCDIARTLDIAEGTAMSHVHRARAALRDRLVTPGGHSGETRYQGGDA